MGAPQVSKLLSKLKLGRWKRAERNIWQILEETYGGTRNDLDDWSGHTDLRRKGTKNKLRVTGNL